MKKALVLALLLGLFAQGQAVQGEALWKRLCAQCHGGGPRGRGPTRASGRRPPSLGPLRAGATSSSCSSMESGGGGPHAGLPQLGDEELAALLNHLMALLKVRAEPFNPEDIKRERGQNLAPDRIQRP